MKVTLKKGKMKGTIKVIASKSYAHRFLCAFMLADSNVTLKNVYFSDDVNRTINAIKAIGKELEITDNTVTFKKGFKKADKITINAFESGTTLRLLIPISLLYCDDVYFLCEKRLITRGINPYISVFKEIGINVETTDDGFHIQGKLKASDYHIDAHESSQYISGLLFALPLLNNDSTIYLEGVLESKNYVLMTIDVLKKCHIDIDYQGDKIFIKGNQTYIASDDTVEGDYSNAAFLDAFNYFDNNIKLLSLNKNSLQGDKIYKEYFSKLSSSFATIDLSNSIDLGPIMFCFASLMHGAKFVGTNRLRIKESDRIASMKEELNKIGVKLTNGDDYCIIDNTNLHYPVDIFSSHNDHRITMALSLLVTKYDITIDNYECVKKSYPNYFKILEELGLEVHYEE